MRCENPATFSAITVLERQNYPFCVPIVSERSTGVREYWRPSAARWANALSASLLGVGKHNTASYAARLGHKSDPAKAVGTEHIVRENELITRRALRRQ